MLWGRRGEAAYALELYAEAAARRNGDPEPLRCGCPPHQHRSRAVRAGDGSPALDLLDDAFRLSRSGDDPLSGGQVLNDVAAVLMIEERYDEAARMLQRAILLRRAAEIATVSATRTAISA